MRTWFLLLAENWISKAGNAASRERVPEKQVGRRVPVGEELWSGMKQLALSQGERWFFQGKLWLWFSLTQKSVFITGCVQSFLLSFFFLKYLHQCPATESSTGCWEISLFIYKLMPFLIPLDAFCFMKGIWFLLHTIHYFIHLNSIVFYCFPF